MSIAFNTLAEQAVTQSPDIPDSWKQGRTAYGGLSAALLLSRAHGDHADLPPLRSALVNFTGPVTAPPALRTELLRQGRNVTTVYARADIDDRAVCTATFSFGQSRDSHLREDRPISDIKVPESYELFFPEENPFIPAFTKNFDVRLVEGNRPMTGGTSRRLRCWARHKDEASREGEASLLCLADILPPAALPLMTQFGPISSMTWICNFLRPAETEEGWYLVEADLTAALDGYSSQIMRIWNTDGDLIVEGAQSIAVFA